MIFKAFTLIIGARLGAALGTNAIFKTLPIKYPSLIITIRLLKTTEINPSRKTRVIPHSTVTTKTKVQLLGRMSLLEKNNWQ